MALQLTNILRDVVEDRDQLGRVYLPADDLARFGCAPDSVGPADAARGAAWHFEAGAPSASGSSGGCGCFPLLDHRSRACVAAMAGSTTACSTASSADPGAVLLGRVSLTTKEKVRVAAQGLVGGLAGQDEPAHVVVVGGGLAGIAAALAPPTPVPR